MKRMRYATILIALLGIGLLYSSYYFYSEYNEITLEFDQVNDTIKDYVEAREELEIRYQGLQQDYILLENEKEEYLELISQYEDEIDDIYQSYNDVSSSLDHYLLMNSNTAGYVRITLYNVSFEYPEELIFSVNSLYSGSQTAINGIFIAQSSNLDRAISLSWEKVDSEPNITQTFENAIDSFSVVKSLNQSYIVNDQDKNYSYINMEAFSINSYNFYLVSSWYEEFSNYHYVLIIQSYRNDTIEQFESFITSYRSINSTGPLG